MFTHYFESNEISIVPRATNVIVHNFGVKPKAAEVVVVNKIAEFEHVPGDESLMPNMFEFGGNYFGALLDITSTTQATLVIGKNGVRTLVKGVSNAGAPAICTAQNWRLKVRLYA